MAKQDIIDALTVRLHELGYGPGPGKTVELRARVMADTWLYYSRNMDAIEQGDDTANWRDRYDPEILRLLNAYLDAKTEGNENGKEA